MNPYEVVVRVVVWFFGVLGLIGAGVWLGGDGPGTTTACVAWVCAVGVCGVALWWAAW